MPKNKGILLVCQKKLTRAILQACWSSCLVKFGINKPSQPCWPVTETTSDMCQMWCNIPTNLVDIKKFHLANTAVIGLISILIVIVTYIDMYKTKARPQ